MREAEHIAGLSKIAAGAAALVARQDVASAIHAAGTALENNFTVTAYTNIQNTQRGSGAIVEEIDDENEEDPDLNDAASQKAQPEDRSPKTKVPVPKAPYEKIGDSGSRLRESMSRLEALDLTLGKRRAGLFSDGGVLDTSEYGTFSLQRRDSITYASNQEHPKSSHYYEHNSMPVTFQLNRDEYLQTDTFESALIGIGRSATSTGQTAKRFYLQGGAKLGLVDQAEADAYVRSVNAEKALYKSTPVAHSFAGQAGELAMDLSLCYTPARIAGIGLGSLFSSTATISALGESGIALANRTAGFTTTRSLLTNTALGFGTLGAWTIFSANNSYNPYIQSDTSTIYRNTQNPEVHRDLIRGLMSTPPVATPPHPDDEDIFDRMIRCDGYGEFSRIKGTKYWATIDQGVFKSNPHGGVYWKIYKQMDGQLIHQ
jgi:hypothetical protein